ncbi:MAG: hypothetical protein V1844_03370 [Pseudomonadota bacterium]
MKDIKKNKQLNWLLDSGTAAALRPKRISGGSYMRMFGQLLFLWLLGLIFIVSCSTTTKSTAEDNIQPQSPTMGSGISMRVLWTVSEYRLVANAEWGNEEARKLLFKPLDITATTITFDGKKCSEVTFKKETVTTKEYMDKLFHITPQFLGIADETIEVVKTDCNLPGFAEYLRLKDRRLVIHINGVFFFLEPFVSY